MPAFNLDKMPRQDGKVAVVTGANSGIGLYTARGLAERGVHVVMACRNQEKAAAAKTQLEEQVPGGSFDVMKIDTSSLASVQTFAEEFSRKHDALDYLLNNAGVMATEQRYTDDGLELQFETNFLGHFALTGHLLDRLEAADSARVITLSSIAHRRGKIDFDDLQSRRKYNKWGAYGQSKLACLIFAYELDRRLREAGSSVISIAAHPGVSTTNLTHNLPWYVGLVAPLFAIMGQSAEKGAEPSLMAALHPNVRGGQYLGPGGGQEYKGDPEAVPSTAASRDREAAARLWTVSEELAGVHYPGPVVAA